MQDVEDQDVEVEWKIKVIDNQSFNILVSFSETKFISQFKTLDEVLFKILNSEVFHGHDGIDVNIPERETEIVIPKLYKPDYIEEDSIEVLSDAFEQSVKAFMGANAFISLAIAGAM